jgi:hypothetical protein
MQGSEKGGPVLLVSRKTLGLLGVLKLRLAETTPLHKILNQRHKHCVLFMQSPFHELHVLLCQLLEVAGGGVCCQNKLRRRVNCNIGEGVVAGCDRDQAGALLSLCNTPAAPDGRAAQG